MVGRRRSILAHLVVELIDAERWEPPAAGAHARGAVLELGGSVAIMVVILQPAS